MSTQPGTCFPMAERVLQGLGDPLLGVALVMLSVGSTLGPEEKSEFSLTYLPLSYRKGAIKDPECSAKGRRVL